MTVTSLADTPGAVYRPVASIEPPPDAVQVICGSGDIGCWNWSTASAVNCCVAPTASPAESDAGVTVKEASRSTSTVVLLVVEQAAPVGNGDRELVSAAAVEGGDGRVGRFAVVIAEVHFSRGPRGQRGGDPLVGEVGARRGLRSPATVSLSVPSSSAVALAAAVTVGPGSVTLTSVLPLMLSSSASVAVIVTVVVASGAVYVYVGLPLASVPAATTDPDEAAHVKDVGVIAWPNWSSPVTVRLSVSPAKAADDAGVTWIEESTESTVSALALGRGRGRG